MLRSGEDAPGGASDQPTLRALRRRQPIPANAWRLGRHCAVLGLPADVRCGRQWRCVQKLVVLRRRRAELYRPPKQLREHDAMLYIYGMLPKRRLEQRQNRLLRSVPGFAQYSRAQ